MITIYEVWVNYAAEKKLSTKVNYHDALKRFKKDNGEKVRWEEITSKFVENWKYIMLKKGLSKTTTNMFLRIFAAILHHAYNNNLFHNNPKDYFKPLSIYSIHSSLSRKDRYLGIEIWTDLWNILKEPNNFFSVKLAVEQKRKLREALALMIFMYLANGMNLIDVCNLKYNHLFFIKQQPMLSFIRHKTISRSDTSIFVPINHELLYIISLYGCKPQLNTFVFPYFINLNSEQEQRKKLMFLSKFISKQMRFIAKIINLPISPTPTWARHSYATNLIQQGVPLNYVSWAMGHNSICITNHYIAPYSYGQMIKYNSLLLMLKKDNNHEDIIEQLCNLSSHDFYHLLEIVCRKRQQKIL